MAFFRSVLYVMFCGVVSHFVGEALPRSWFHYERFPFTPRRWEKNGTVYERIRIQDWKDHMPDMSRVMKNMVPKRVGICPTSEQVRTLVVETCVAEVTHTVLCMVAPVIWLFWKSWMGVFLSGVVIACNIPFILIQRYNRPVLVALAQRLELREERRRNASAHTVG